jgi:hypothetical protein
VFGTERLTTMIGRARWSSRLRWIRSLYLILHAIDRGHLANMGRVVVCAGRLPGVKQRSVSTKRRCGCCHRKFELRAELNMVHAPANDNLADWAKRRSLAILIKYAIKPHVPTRRVPGTAAEHRWILDLWNSYRASVAGRERIGACTCRAVGVSACHRPMQE